MNDTPRRERRSPVVVLLDAVLALAAALQTGQLPGRRVREGGPARRGVVWLTVGIIAAIAGTVVLTVTIVRTPGGLASLPPTAAEAPPPLASASPSLTVSPSSTGSSTSPAASPSFSPSASPSRSPGKTRTASSPATVALPLTARYTADAGGSGLLGYRATVTITNPAASPKSGWSLTVTLPRPTLAVDQVSGATAEQDGSTWTFTPDGSTTRIAAGGTVAVAFSVRGATLLDAAPRDCRIDGDLCSGLGA